MCNSLCSETSLKLLLTNLENFIPQIIALLIHNCDVHPERSYATQWQYLKSYHYLLIALSCIYYSGHWMLLALQLSGISMTCKILQWLCHCVCNSVCVLSAYIVSSSHKPHTQANRSCTPAVNNCLCAHFKWLLTFKTFKTTFLSYF